MSRHRETLLALPNVHACLEAITTLRLQFKAQHGRNTIVDLVYSNTFSTDPMRADEADGHLVTLQVDPFEGAEPEVQWFRAAARMLTV